MTREEREDVTNGDMIKAMLNPYKICVYEYSVHIYMTEGDFRKAEYQMNCDTSWWNAPYNEGEYKIVRKHGEQEPCGDCISREYVIKLLENTKRTRKEITNRIYEVPSVTPQQKMGMWLIKRVGDYDHAVCSVCGDDSYLLPEWDALELYKYCPNCGCKMQEVEEWAEKKR